MTTEIKKVDQIVEKWEDVLESKEAGELSGYKKVATAMMLENQHQYIMNEAETTNVTGGVQKWDPILVGMLRRAAPKLIAFDIAGVQPMSGPSGLLFVLRSKYTNQAGTEALYNEADTAFSGSGTHPTGSIFSADASLNATPATADTQFPGEAMATALAETLGIRDNTGAIANDFNEMALSVEKYSINAGTRALKAEYSLELEQDMKAVHGLDAEKELTDILATEITQEINRELLRKMYFVAKLGAQDTTTAGAFDLSVDSNGRWSVEQFKGLLFQIEKERNAIAIETRRGKGNFIVTSSNVASALAMTGLLDGTSLGSDLSVDPAGATFVGTVNGMSVYVDPYINEDFVLVGYKGASPMDAGMFYAPYVPLTLMKATHSNSFQPAIGFKSRYAVGVNPVENGRVDIDVTSFRTNPYYRIFRVDNIL